MRHILLLVIFAVLAWSPSGWAAQQSAPHEATAKASPKAEEPLSVTEHSIVLNGKTIPYTATAGYMRLEEQKADVFFVAYIKKDEERRTRPITFFFNGGPGASSLWLHFGAAGPKRIGSFYKGTPLAPPYTLHDNEYSWLDLTDLVFIDPVSTGYSRAVSKESGEKFYSVRGDIQSVGAFVRLYTTRYNRWLSPKIIAGESYGTFRAVGLAHHLFTTYGLTANALVLISTALDFQTFSFTPGNDLPYISALPSYAATAAYHHKSSLQDKALEQELDKVVQWALTGYTAALAKGDALPENERALIAEKLSSLTGLSKEYILNNNLRIERSQFMHELLKAEDRTLGLLDSRYTIKGQPGDLFYNDPSFSGTLGAFVAVANDYFRNVLGYKSDLPYEYLSKKANRAWDWGSALQGFPTVLDDLETVLSKARYLKVFIASGYYDLNTPYFGAVYNVNHLGIEPALRNNITMQFYKAGHQLYTDKEAMEKLRRDIEAFYGTLPH